VYPRGGKWWGVIPRTGGEATRESLGIASTAPETEAMAIWLERARGQRAADAAATTPRVGDAFDAFIISQKRRGRSESTREIDDTKAGHFIRLWGRGMPLRNVNAVLVEQYITTREEESAAPNTIARELVVLRGMLKVAIHHGTFVTPLERVMPLGFDAKYEPRSRWISQDEALRLFNELPIERRGWFAFALATAGRRSEIERARLEDFGDDAVYMRGSKTKASRSETPITSIQKPWLERARKHAAKGGPAFGPWTNALRGLAHACSRLSTCSDCRKGRRRDGLARGTPDPLCLGCKRTPRFERVTPNDLRRSVGWWLRDGGVDPHLIAKVLRHVDARMAEKVYARGSKRGVLESIEAQLAVRNFVRNSRARTTKLRQRRRAKARKTA
jgi:integrase